MLDCGSSPPLLSASLSYGVSLGHSAMMRAPVVDMMLRDEREITAMFAAMPRQWVEYSGRTPALSLKVRGLSNELYCRVAGKHLTEAPADPGMDSVLAPQARQR
jgi:hypothetical protein